MELLDALGPFAASYAATLAMGCACSYLGLFTVLRRIVFTGVALAQLAAAGVASAFFVADHPLTPRPLADLAARHGATTGSLAFALLGALGLQLRTGQKRVAPDAVVGITYSASAALAILLVWRSARGLSELRDILAGEVLLTRQGELVTLWVGLAAVAVVHAIWRREFLIVSYDPEFAAAQGMPERRYQLLLLGSLAVAVALSLKAGGLLLVFSFLVLPPVAGLMLGRGLSESTVLALAIAASSSLVGFLGAIRCDFPVAPTIAVVQLASLGLASLGRAHVRAGTAARAIFFALGALALVAAPIAGLARPRSDAAEPPPAPSFVAPPAPHVHGAPAPRLAAQDALEALASTTAPAQRAAAAASLGVSGDVQALVPLLLTLGDEDESVEHAAADALERLAMRADVRAALEGLLDASDPEVRVRAAVTLVRLGEPRGLETCVRALDAPDVALLLREAALRALWQPAAGDAKGYDPYGTAEENGPAVEAWRAWWRDVGPRLKWDPAQRRFEVGS